MKINYNGVEQSVFKSALHTHTTNSDGKFSPEEVIGLYQKKGYDVLAFTDHRKTNPVSSYDGKNMTLLSGIELHPAGPRDIRWHILGLGVPENFSGCEPASGQEAVDAVLDSGGVAFAAHPYWCGFTAAEVASLKGISGIEVYNSSCRYIGKEYNMSYWDELLDAGCRYSALAVDDVHHPHDLFRGFTMIIAPDKSPQSLINALRNGDFYASQGPLFTSLNFKGGVISADFTASVAAVCCMRRSSGRCVAVEDNDGPGSGNKEVTHLEFDLGDIHDQYIRIQLRDADGRMAWSNPFYLK